jgi:hypothetical protein
MEDNKKQVDTATKKNYNKTYYETHKKEITQRIVCGCGLSYIKSNKSIHCDGRVHKLWHKLTNEKKQ